MKKRIFIKLFFFALVVSQSFDLFSQSNEINNIAKELKSHKVYEWAICPETKKSDQINNFYKLSNIATDQELIVLLSSKSPVVTAYAFSALVKREQDSLMFFLYRHLNDFRKLKVLIYGCEFIHGSTYETTVADFFLREAKDFIKGKHKSEIDSLLLYSSKRYNFLEYLLDDEEFEKKYHERIEELVLSNQYKYAPIALARYQDTTDLKLLESKLFENPYYTIPLIEEFPHEYFKIFITEYGRNERKLDFMLYKAAAIYQDTFALSFLTNEFKRVKNDYIGDERCKYIYEAILKYQSPIYDSLFFELWERDYLINDTLFLYLVGVNREKSVYLAGISLQNVDLLEAHSLVINEMLYYLVENKKETAKEIIVDQLNRNESLYYYPEFAENAKYFKEKEVINALFSRLKKSENAYIYYPIVETILSFKDDILNQELIETIKNNDKIDDWGLEKVNKKLKENNLIID